MTWTPPPGTIGLTYSYGTAALRAALGQMLLNEITSYSHAFIVVDDTTIMEPWPSGARITDICDYEEEVIAYGWIPGLTPDQRHALVRGALQLDGIGHGLTDYLALAAHRYRWRSARAGRRMASARRLLPAQFVAESYRRAGIDILPGFAPGDVGMEDLWKMLLTSTTWELRIPCAEFGVPGGRYAR